MCVKTNRLDCGDYWLYTAFRYKPIRTVQHGITYFSLGIKAQLFSPRRYTQTGQAIPDVLEYVDRFLWEKRVLSADLLLPHMLSVVRYGVSVWVTSL